MSSGDAFIMRQACQTVETLTSTAGDSSVAGTRGAGNSAVTISASRSSAAATICSDNSDVDAESSWFAGLVRQILPREKAGLAICTEAGLDHNTALRSCERYAAGHVKVTGYIVRALLRSESGLTWLRGYMDGASPEWWQDVEDAIELLDAVRATRAASQQRRG